jgi:drug/metabolite transporter (DMT)-like permease
MVRFMTAIALALAASLAWGCSDFLGGLQSRRAALIGVLTISQVAGLAMVLPVAIASGEPLPGGGAALWATGAGLAELVAFAAFYRALAVGSMHLIAPIAGTGALIPLAVDLAAGHRPGTAAAVGVVLALAGAALSSCECGSEGRRVTRGAGLAVIAAVGFGVFFVGLDAAADSGVWWPVVFSRVGSLGALCVVALARRSPPFVARPSAAAVAMVGVLDIGANALFVAALGQGLAGVVSVLGSLYPLTTAALAWLLLRERASLPQGLGVAGALAGVALVSLGA